MMDEFDLDRFTTKLEPAAEPLRRKPCIALMGEFSAGKSTLSNLLIGQSPLPVKVTATQLPPVRISQGTGQAWREDLDGNIHPLDIDALTDVSPSDTKLVQIFVEADLLDQCDLIDMPGISDPNMAAEVWKGAIGLADGVIWCTHATQAWRQSEAAVWEELSPELAEKSLLLLTRCDKLVTEQDRTRVLRRVIRETEGMFCGVYPISLTQAVEGRNDWDLWRSSGAEDFSQAFVTLLNRLQGGTETGDSGAVLPFPRPRSAPDQVSGHDHMAAEDEAEYEMDDPGGVRPRRVTIAREADRSNRPSGDRGARLDLV